MAGSRPMLQEAGSDLPMAQAFSRNAPMCRPTLMLTLMRSGPCTHMRWMVTSEMPVSGSSARRRPRLKNGPASLGVLWMAGM